MNVDNTMKAFLVRLGQAVAAKRTVLGQSMEEAAQAMGVTNKRVVFLLEHQGEKRIAKGGLAVEYEPVVHIKTILKAIEYSNISWNELKPEALHMKKSINEYVEEIALRVRLCKESTDVSATFADPLFDSIFELLKIVVLCQPLGFDLDLPKASAANREPIT